MTHVAQKPHVSEYVANRFLESFWTSVVAYNITERNVVNIDEARYHNGEMPIPAGLFHLWFSSTAEFGMAKPRICGRLALYQDLYRRYRILSRARCTVLLGVTLTDEKLPPFIIF